MQWRNIRRTYQIFFGLLFLVLLYAASYMQIRESPLEFFLHFDPLLALGATLAGKVLYAAMSLSLIVVGLTLIFGRVFCSWICPLGILNHWLSAIPAPLKKRQRILNNEYKPAYQTKYYVLIALLLLAFLGINQTGLLDPQSLLMRSFAVSVFPSLQLSYVPIYVRQPYYAGGWLVGLLFLMILAANLFVMRLWCRLLCPLGALLGGLSKFSLLRIYKRTDKCVSCGACSESCHGACNPHEKIRGSECLMCLNCLHSCKQGAQSYGFLPPLENETASPDLQRRKTMAAMVTGVALAPMLRTSYGVAKGADHDVIRPPGSLAEEYFAETCVKCGACVRVCPTQVIHPAGLQAGFEGLWTPVLRYENGYCLHTCTLCSQVCPTGAIKRITISDRVGDPPQREPIKLGTAFFDFGRCLPWAMATPCIVCEEMCPTTPKAIWLETVEVKNREGVTVKLKRPHLDPKKCIGCGICQSRCPVGAQAAIRVSSVGETRQPQNQLLLR